MKQELNNGISDVLEQVISGGAEEMTSVFTSLFNLAMRIERERFLGAGAYERSSSRQGYANGVRPKRVDTPSGTLNVDVPKTRGTEAPFYPQSLEQGKRSCRALQLCVAEMYIQGVSTRDVEKVMKEFGLKSISSTEVSRAAKVLDEELQAWRERELGEFPYLQLDARYEKVRIQGVVRSAAVLSAVGVGKDGARRMLGVSVALSEAEIHWRAFLESLTKRGLHGVQCITSDDHAGLRCARQAVFAGAPWQRCQFHLSQNAIQHAPSQKVRGVIGKQLRSVWNADTLEKSEKELSDLVAQYRETAPKLADWLEENIPEGLTVFSLPEEHRRRMRTSNPIERAVQQEIKRRTQKVRVFPNEEALLRLVTAIIVQIDEKWATSKQPYIKWRNPEG